LVDILSFLLLFPSNAIFKGNNHLKGKDDRITLFLLIQLALLHTRLVFMAKKGAIKMRNLFDKPVLCILN